MSKGKFVWHELMTTDVAAGGAFFSEVIGWKTQKVEEMDYTMLLVGELPAAGLMTLPEMAAKAGAPPHWMGHIEVPDAEAASKRAVELGGKVLAPTQTIPNVGSFAILADPQGVAFSAFQPANSEDRPKAEGNGTITWNELNTTDWESAWKFYSELFGWETTETMDMGPEFGTYHMFKDAGSEQPVGGMSNHAKSQGFPAHWAYYINVDDLDAALERVKTHGGKLLNGPMEVPGGDKVAQCVDPQGAAFALHWTNKTA